MRIRAYVELLHEQDWAAYKRKHSTGSKQQILAAAPALLTQHATVDEALRARRALLEAAVPGRYIE